MTKFFRFDDQVLDIERRELRRAAKTERASDEHGRLDVSGATNRFNIGAEIRLIPGHYDPTVTLYVKSLVYGLVRNVPCSQIPVKSFPERLVCQTASSSSDPITARGAVY